MNAICLNCTLKRSPEPSNGEAPAEVVMSALREDGVQTEAVRLADYRIEPGVVSEAIVDGDEWPEIRARSSRRTSSSWRHPHRRPARMGAWLDEAEDPERQQRDRSCDMQRARLHDRSRAEHDGGDEHDRQLVADGDRHEGTQHPAAFAVLHALRDGEQPPHRRVEAVVGAQRRERQPDAGMAHGKQ
jgi:hypothetical protein